MNETVKQRERFLKKYFVIVKEDNYSIHCSVKKENDLKLMYIIYSKAIVFVLPVLLERFQNFKSNVVDGHLYMYIDFLAGNVKSELIFHFL